MRARRGGVLAAALAVGALVLVLLPGVTGTPAMADEQVPSAPAAARPLVAGGYQHTCAVLENGDVQCWGQGYYGQLGYGDDADRPVPDGVVDLPRPAVGIAAGWKHTCAVLLNGALWCWGANGDGQLGDGTRDTSHEPVRVRLGAKATSVSAGDLHTCAATAGGGVQCWGRNAEGQLGDGSTDATPSPVPVVGLDGPVTTVAAGRLYTCGVLVSGRVQCWGDNEYGQLGTGDNSNRSTPTEVAFDPDVRVAAIDAGHYHTCAVTTPGAVHCWGRGSAGRLGNGGTADTNTPGPALDLDGPAAAVALGRFFSCASLVSGELRCWGDNQEGYLGNGTTTDSPVPVAVGWNGRAATLGAGSWHTCAVAQNGRMRCWGDNAYAKLGYGDDEDRTDAPSSLPNVGLDGRVRVRAATVLRVQVKPRRDRKAPFRWRVRGRVAGPFIAEAATCRGTVRVQVRKGKRVLARKSVRVRGNCLFATKVGVANRKVPQRKRVRLVLKVVHPRTDDLARSVNWKRVVAR